MDVLLTALLQQEIKKYAVETVTPAGPSRFYYTENLNEQVYCITAPYTSAEMYARLILMARVVDDHVIIDVDKTNKPLAEALQQAGIPRDQIVLAWER